MLFNKISNFQNLSIRNSSNFYNLSNIKKLFNKYLNKLMYYNISIPKIKLKLNKLKTLKQLYIQLKPHAFMKIHLRIEDFILKSALVEVDKTGNFIKKTSRVPHFDHYFQNNVFFVIDKKRRKFLKMK